MPRRLASTVLVLITLAAATASACSVDEGPQTSCTRQDGSDPSWALRCGGPSAESLVGLAVSAGGTTFIGVSIYSAPAQLGESWQLGDEDIVAERGDFVLAAFGPEGEASWVRQFGGPESQWLDTISRCGEGFVITGGNDEGASVDLGDGPFDAPSYVAVFDGEGELVWRQAIVPMGGATPHANTTAAACDASGNLVLTGGLRNGADFGGGPIWASDLFDGFVVSYGPDGAHRWSQAFGGTGTSTYGRAVAMTAAGEVVVVGSFDDSVDLGGGPLTASEGDDVLVAKLDGDGGHLWSQQIGTTGLQYGSAVAVDGAGTIAVGGIFLESIELDGQIYTNTFPDAEPDIDGTVYDGFIATYTSDGTPAWSTIVASRLDDDVDVLAYTDDGTLILTGFVDERPVARSYLAGAMVDEYRVTGLDEDDRSWIAVGPSGDLVLGAEPRDDVDLGLGLLAGRGEADLLLARLVSW